MTAAGMLPRLAHAETWNQAAFAAKSVDDAVKLLGGSARSKAIRSLERARDRREWRSGAARDQQQASGHRVDRHPDREESEDIGLESTFPQAPCPMSRRV